jgi:hypothetical protein
MMRGRAEVNTGDGSEIDDEIRRITRRYIPGVEVEAYIADWLDLRTIVSIAPDKITAWGSGF